jgi:hypothetical protein
MLLAKDFFVFTLTTLWDVFFGKRLLRDLAVVVWKRLL